VRVLVADDDPNLLAPLEIALRRAGYTVVSAPDGRQAWALFQQERPDFAVLDIAMPGLSGLELARRIGDAGQPRVPIILLTGHDDENDKVDALESGVDDYVVKPVTARELIARIHAVQRRARPSTLVITAARLAINPATHQFWIDGREVDVTGTEFALLRALIERAGQAVRPAELMQRIWGYAVSDDLLRVTIYRLRRKIEPQPNHPVHIIRVPGSGFMVRGD
jgi:DNA-binding response OmpR family regulator